MLPAQKPMLLTELQRKLLPQMSLSRPKTARTLGIKARVPWIKAENGKDNVALTRVAFALYVLYEHGLVVPTVQTTTIGNSNQKWKLTFEGWVFVANKETTI